MNNDAKELIGMLIVLTVIIAGVQWFLVRFTHWSVALGVTGLIAFFIGFLYVSLKHATPNGGSNGPDSSEYITPMFVIFASLLCGLALVCHLTQNRVPKKAYLIPLALILMFAILRYVYVYIADATFYHAQFSSCKIELVDETGGTSVVEQISFQNPSNGYTTDIRPDFKEEPYPHIVRFADKIIFRNYSAKAGQSFTKEFPFDYNLLKEKKGVRIGFVFWLHQKIVLPMKIVLKPYNVVELYIDNHFVKQYQLNSEDFRNKNI
ncbi:hypothetical protein [Flavobacterium hydrophilum]|uniref:Uncharacterized protein n=1 Tax=Flavobacterium hydrophilum TaxID=2211445 RepID=A0A2V4C7E1_9FLAO|nr:hypothetical protein [Flavobacterium hydrophilum]PXY46995.1 hypothetical protein DMB68_07565 [Flavobacterium hydrophilum]